MSDAKVRFFNEDMGPAEVTAEVWFFGYACPKDTDVRIDGLAVRRPEQPVEHPSWIWDGNIQFPTFEPSIDSTGVCTWHGYIRNGRCVDTAGVDEPEPSVV